MYKSSHKSDTETPKEPEPPSPHFKAHFHHTSTNSVYGIAQLCKQAQENKQSNGMKIAHIPRYASEDELKRLRCNPVYLIPEYEGYGYEDSVKKANSKELSLENSAGSSRSSSKAQSKVETVLKETSSTACATIISPRKHKSTVPAFLKTKSRTSLFTRNHPRQLNRSSFRALRKLGEGKFGRVFLALDLATGFLVAMKVVEKRKIIEGGFLDQFIRQLKIQTFLKHPNIIEVYGFFEDNECFFTLMELGCDGHLYTLISEKNGLTEETTSFIVKNLLQAVDYMHQHKILHRDIKLENIVRIMGNVKICDFGWAANKITKEELRSTYCGTPLYLSPEILQGHKYDEKVDLWAVGIIAYELLLGQSPFQIYEHSDLHKILTEDVQFPSAKKVSKEFEEFIQKILNKNPQQRPNSSELLMLKFIRKYEAFETCEELCQ